jgi:hypothetical protein
VILRPLFITLVMAGSLVNAAEVEVRDLALWPGCRGANIPAMPPTERVYLWGLVGHVGNSSKEVNLGISEFGRELPRDTKFEVISDDVFVSEPGTAKIKLGKISGINAICADHSGDYGPSYIQLDHPEIHYEPTIRVTYSAKVEQCQRSESVFDRVTDFLIFQEPDGAMGPNKFNYNILNTFRFYDLNGKLLSMISQRQQVSGGLENKNSCEASRKAMSNSIKANFNN